VLIHDLADIFRRMMWISAGAGADEADAPLVALSKAYGKTACVRALDILLRKEYEMRQNLRADIVLETAVMALMAPEDDAASPDAARIEKLEARLAALEQRAISAPAAPPDTPAKPEEGPQDASADALWQKVLHSIKGSDYIIYTHAGKASGVTLAGNRLDVQFESHEVSAEFLKQDDARKTVEEALAVAAGRPVSLSVTYRKREAAGASPAKLYGEDIEEI
jgi:hypothetical protein